MRRRILSARRYRIGEWSRLDIQPRLHMTLPDEIGSDRPWLDEIQTTNASLAHHESRGSGWRIDFGAKRFIPLPASGGKSTEIIYRGGSGQRFHYDGIERTWMHFPLGVAKHRAPREPQKTSGKGIGVPYRPSPKGLVASRRCRSH